MDGAVELITDLGTEPLTRWAAIAAEHDVAASWEVRCTAVAASVADTWRVHAQVSTVGAVRIVPAWKSTEAGPFDVLIDPGGSFGMGDHPTTRATLQLALRAEGSNVLDLGCGSGVLAIALAKLRGLRGVAVDIAPAAIEATGLNANLNGVAEMLVIVEGDVRNVRGTYDIVLANILAPVLLSDARDIAATVAFGGSLILSGFTASRVSDVRRAYEELGFRQGELVVIDGWYALEMQRFEKD